MEHQKTKPPLPPKSRSSQKSELSAKQITSNQETEKETSPDPTTPSQTLGPNLLREKIPKRPPPRPPTFREEYTSKPNGPSPHTQQISPPPQQISPPPQPDSELEEKKKPKPPLPPKSNWQKSTVNSPPNPNSKSDSFIVLNHAAPTNAFDPKSNSFNVNLNRHVPPKVDSKKASYNINLDNDTSIKVNPKKGSFNVNLNTNDSPSIQPSATFLQGKPIKEGFLAKKGHHRRNWLVRWFVLTPEGLAYYASPSKSELKGFISFANKSDITIQSAKELGMDFKSKQRDFSIVLTIKSKEKQYVIDPQSEPEMRAWTRVISQVLSGHTFDELY